MIDIPGMIRSVYLSDERSEGPLCDSDQIEKKNPGTDPFGIHSRLRKLESQREFFPKTNVTENQSGRTSKCRAIEIRARRLLQEYTAEYCGVSGRLRSEQVHLIGFRSPLPRIRLEETAMRQDCF